MIRLDEKQYRAVKKMTRAACANNDCGNCLLLDDGETCVCVQSISYSLLCRYFREAVLPADRQLCEQITRSGETDLKRCAVCGSTFAAGSNRAKYCPDCAAKIRRRQKLITEIEGHFTELQQQRQAEQEQGDTFSIYQLKRGDETRDLRFEPYDRLQAAGLTIDRVNYELVYTAPLTKDMTLGDIWERFNIDHPADFKGHSLSVSDIVVLHQNDEDTAHYVDSIGFQQVPEFLQEQQTPVFDKLPPEQQQALSDTVQDTLQMLVDADKRIYGDVTGKTLEAIAAQGYSYKDGQLEKQQPEATPRQPFDG